MPSDQILKAIIEAMEQQKVSAADLARLTKCTQQEIGRWLSGARTPTVANLEMLAAAVGLELVVQPKT